MSAYGEKKEVGLGLLELARFADERRAGFGVGVASLSSVVGSSSSPSSSKGLDVRE